MVEIIDCTAEKISVTLKTDFDFLFLLLYAFPPTSLGATQSFGQNDDYVWARKSNGSGRYGGTYRALSAECHAFVELPKTPPGRLWHSNRNSGNTTVAWTCVDTPERLFGEALRIMFLRLVCRAKRTDDGVPGERNANAFWCDLTLDTTHTVRSLPFRGLRRLSPASTNR